jgi:hypothetical protein
MVSWRSKLPAADAALWHTVSLNQALDRREHAGLPTVQPPFALERGEVAYASGDLSMLNVIAYGIPGADLLRPRQSRGLRTFRWAAGSTSERGRLWVTSHGFRLDVLHGILAWPWQSVQSIEMVGPGQLLMVGTSSNGTVRWLIGSDWSELLFTLWARGVNPAHPMYRARSWIPPGWQQRVSKAGLELPTSSATRHPEVHQ